MTSVAIAGASGFVGRALTARMADKGHAVVALSRSVIDTFPGATSVGVDVSDEAATAAALAGVDTAYYLVHSMAAGASFRDLDQRLARGFGRAAARARSSGIGRQPASAASSTPYRHHMSVSSSGSRRISDLQTEPWEPNEREGSCLRVPASSVNYSRHTTPAFAPALALAPVTPTRDS